MKKKFYLPTIILLLCFAAFNSNAAIVTDDNKAITKEAAVNAADEQKQARLEEITARVQEIKAMDKSQLSREDRKELRTELKAMKKETHAKTSVGVYISIGAIIVILLVLLLLL